MEKPNILFVMSDDHASHAMSCYGSKINQTPNLDRIAEGGMRFDNCFCTNGICTPSRAAILTGNYNHINGVTTLSTHMDNRLQTFPKLLQEAGYQTGIFGKWHLGRGPEHCPTGFDEWTVLPGQGLYHNPEFIFHGPEGGTARTVQGYVTDLITDFTLDFLARRDRDRPFCALYHHKAPHRHWEPDEKHAHLYLNEEISEPETLYDDYSNRSAAAREARMRVGVDMRPIDLKCELPDLPEMEMRKWAYQRYIKDYLRVVASIDSNVGRVLDYLDEEGIADNTVVIYTSDQGFYLGDHGWYDKRFMYEESLRMPFIIRHPQGIAAGRVNEDMILNVDFAPLFLDLAGLPVSDDMQGRSFRPLLNGETPDDWRQGMYYRYWMHGDGAHNVYAHYGLRTHQHKLIYFYNDGLNQPGSGHEAHQPEWELFDLEKDPYELKSVYDDPMYADLVPVLKDELHRLQDEVRDERYPPDVD
ncbi:MAG: sulfatase [Candidatus Latescibacterota bacterium]|nr:sulfatase [Candidatus Latescibacterota bacterium]